MRRLAVAVIVAVPMVAVGIPLLERPAAEAQAQIVALNELNSAKVPEFARPHLQRAAKTCAAITAPVLAAQIQQESNWNPRAVSPVGAQGIAQFMPGTWTSYGVDGNNDGKRDPLDPADAIPAQAKYMCDAVAAVQRAKLPGDTLDLALASYNAGFGAVERYRGIPPYAETVHYVRRIRETIPTFAISTRGGGGATGPSRGWMVPVDGRCTSGFGPRWGTTHYGLDIAAPIGTPIKAAADGRVVAAGPASGYGLWVKLEHANGVVTIYGHNDRNVISTGSRVKAGQQIATVGNRGESTGPHVHFQIEINGAPADPLSFYQSVGGPALCG